jgi:hypothetical protein
MKMLGSIHLVARDYMSNFERFSNYNKSDKAIFLKRPRLLAHLVSSMDW